MKIDKNRPKPRLNQTGKPADEVNMRLFIIIHAFILTGCLSDSGGGTGAISTNPATTPGIVFTPTDLSSYTGTWLDQTDSNMGLVIDSSGNVTGTVEAWNNAASVAYSCSFSGTLNTTVTSLGTNAYQLTLSVPTGTYTANYDYCPNKLSVTFPASYTIRIVVGSNTCFTTANLGYNKTYCKQ